MATVVALMLAGCGGGQAPVGSDPKITSGVLPTASPPPTLEVEQATAPAIIYGRLVDADGKPVKGIPVVPIPDDGTPAPDIAVVSTEDGNFTWVLAPGQYRLVAGNTAAGPFKLEAGQRMKTTMTLNVDH